jgi:hypothetical protein
MKCFSLDTEFLGKSHCKQMHEITLSMIVILLSARKSKLQKQEEDEHQRLQQVTRALLFLEVCNMLDEYQNETTRKKEEKKQQQSGVHGIQKQWLTLMI